MNVGYASEAWEDEGEDGECGKDFIAQDKRGLCLQSRKVFAWSEAGLGRDASEQYG